MSSITEVGHEEAEAPPESGRETATTAEDEVTLKPVKPEAAAEGNSAYINIKVTSQIFPDVIVRAKRGVLLQCVMDMYCGKHSLKPNAVVFLDEEGKNMRASQTEEEAGLDDGHSISVNIAQLGGSGRYSA
uniref:Ubiquitin-like domain-containing protein n=1 Tax=Hordeum vulgare subsp. vulgare TaxID=112509 RepID=A0A8I6XSA7_HORVV